MIFARKWSEIVCRHAGIVVLVALAITVLAIDATRSLKISTRLEALMPEAAASVRTLNAALRKTGSFASIQVVAHAQDPETALRFIRDAQATIDRLDWVSSTQYSEDISVLDEHKLLLLDPHQLLEIEQEVEDSLPSALAHEIEQLTGIPMTIELREQNIRGSSDEPIHSDILEQLSQGLGEPVDTNRLFVSEDRKTAVLVVWPEPGRDGLADAKRMISEVEYVVDALGPTSYGDGLRAGVAGRIKNKVAQYDAVVSDLKFGLLGSVSLIILLLLVAFRSAVAIPLIILPLIMGIIWTIGLTAATIGGLNLITVFLALILFGLGIDFGIHNYSRFKEVRGKGGELQESIFVVISQTGAASLIAAATTALGFFALMLTDFRAFAEFGFIAGSGIVLVFITMYTIFPALIVLFERHFGWHVKSNEIIADTGYAAYRVIGYRLTLAGAVLMVMASVYYVQHIPFEKNFKNLQAERTVEHVWATEQVKQVFPDGHDRAIIVAETQEQLLLLQEYFRDKIAHDLDTPTIAKVTSILDFLPLLEDQDERLEIIERLRERASEFQDMDPQRYETISRYLDIGNLIIEDLPVALQRTFMGTDSEPGYLMYVYNSVTMDDSDLARQFYDDAAQIELEGQSYAAASEGFIFVEMIALMKDDAVKAVLLVTLTTVILVFGFFRSFIGSFIVLIPPILGVFVTLGFMGAFGPPLSIINMVVLPSLIGISVDNAIHIYHRFCKDGKDADIAHIMNTTGKAAILTTLTTLIGFGGMVTASMGGLRSMGALAIIGFTFCLIMTWAVLPALMRLYNVRLKRIDARYQAKSNS